MKTGIAAWLDDALRGAEGGDCDLLLEVQRLLGRRRWVALPEVTQVRADALLERCA